MLSESFSFTARLYKPMRQMTRTMWGIQDPTQAQLLQTIGLSDNPNLYSSRLEAEAQAKQTGAEVIEVELKY